MDTQQQMEERLWDYIDGRCSVAERFLVEKLLENNAAWKAQYRELLDLQQVLQSGELESPSMRFSKNVMEQIAQLQIAPASKVYINKKIIWGIAIFFIVIIGAFFIYGFGQVEWNAKGDTAISQDLNKIDFNRIFNNIFSNTWVNVFMMINLVLGLFLLDKWLERRKVKEA